jgi:hypothetical protein
MFSKARINKQCICIIARAVEVQVVLNFRTMRPSVRYKFSPLIRLSNAEFGLSCKLMNKHFKLSHSKTEFLTVTTKADSSGRVVLGVGLRPLACWDFWFESLRGHGCLSLVSVMCSQEEVSATG